ncbi:hypothetical protein [Thalassobacillus pellis]|uniref:hypothetical protein n=1 Tax=Thalassobacillus pellis TaxID=748008 RepID=UPI0019609F59|nr:hypothetical protein [Thalassobacillus pellis]MBM7553788.1 hypothetical protein [Thalassobacillus pellis]
MQYSHYGQMNPMKDQCQQYMYYHVVINMADGTSVDGIIENVDDEGVSMLVGEDVMDEGSEAGSEDRQFYGGYPRRRFRRFRRRFFPLGALTSLALYPYLTPYPYYPPYPYPYPYYY